MRWTGFRAKLTFTQWLYLYENLKIIYYDDYAFDKLDLENNIFYYNIYYDDFFCVFYIKFRTENLEQNQFFFT